MENQKQYKSISELMDELKSMTDKIEQGNLSYNELEEVLNTSRELHERLVILKYKAVEKFVKGDEYDDGKHRFKLNLKRTNQLSLEEVISDTVKEKLEKAQTNFLEDLTPEPPITEEPETAVVEAHKEVKEEAKTAPVAPQEKANGSASVNDKFSGQNKKTLADKLNKSPIKNLKEHIGINQKFLFINDLFKGENEVYNAAVNQLNAFENYQQAQDYLNIIKVQLEWDEEHPSTIKFLDYVERRYL
jgi:hypothetical protein